MARTLREIIAHIRLVCSNPAVSTTLIQTEDLELLCRAAETVHHSDCAIYNAPALPVGPCDCGAQPP